MSQPTAILERVAAPQGRPVAPDQSFGITDTAAPEQLLFSVVPSIAGEVALLWTSAGVLRVASLTNLSTSRSGLPSPEWTREAVGRAWREAPWEAPRKATPGAAVCVALMEGRAGLHLVDERIFTSSFQEAVLRLVATIQSGCTMAYGEVARAVGRPGAARAVGRVMSRNPVPLLIPCHRVVAAGGDSGGFSFGGGREIKEHLLAREKEALRAQAGEGVGWAVDASGSGSPG